jgi:hypothetical protein
MSDKRGEQSIEIGKGLSPRGFALQGIEKVYYLHQGYIEMISRIALDLSPDPTETNHEQILKVPAHTIGSQGAKIMYMEFAFNMGFPNFFGINGIEPVVAYYLLGNVHIQTLKGIGHVAVLPDPPVHFVDIILNHGDVTQQLRDLADIFMLFSV